MKKMRNAIGVVFVTLFFTVLAAITLTIGCAPPEELGSTVVIPPSGPSSPTGGPTTLQGKVVEASWTKPERGLTGVQVTCIITGGDNLTTTSSDAGLYVLYNIPIGTHVLRFFKANYEISDVQVVIASTDVGKTKTVTPDSRCYRRDMDTSKGMIQGQVMDENGNPLDGASVKTDLRDPTTGQPYSATTTSVGMPKAGMFQITIPAGATYNLTISKTGYVTYKLKSPVTNLVPKRLAVTDIGPVQLSPTTPGPGGGDDPGGGDTPGPAPTDAKFRPLKGRVVDSVTKLGLNGVKVETEVGLTSYTASDFIHTGVFMYPLAPVGTYRLFATPPPNLGYDPLERGIEVTVPPGSGTYELSQFIELQKSTEDVARVFGQVKDTVSGQPINGATVELGGQITFTGRIGDHYGMYEFPRVRTSTISYYVTVRQTGYIPISQTVKVENANSEYLVNFKVEPFTSDPDRGIVPGTVIESGSFEPVASAKVWIETWDGLPLRFNDDEPPKPDINGTGATVEAMTVVDGSFVFQNIPPTPTTPPQYYNFRADAGAAFLPGYAAGIVVEEGKVTDPPVRIELTGIRGTMSGYIYEDKNGNSAYDKGEGIPGATIEIFGMEDQHSTRTRLDGWYKLEGVPLTRPDEGYFLVAGAGDYLPSAYEDEVPLTPDNPDRDDIDISLRPAKIEGLGHVSGVVTDAYGNILQGISIELDFIYQREGVYAVEVTRFDGSFFMVNRAEGSFLIRAGQNVSDKYIPVLKEVKVTEGKVEDVDFTLNSQSRQLRGTVTDDATGLPLMGVEVIVLDIPKDKQEKLTTTTAANGSYVLPKMPVGSGWRIQFSKDNYDTWVEIIDVRMDEFRYTDGATFDDLDVQLALIVGEIAGVVYEDENSNGTREIGEDTPIQGINVYLLDEGNKKIQSRVTGTDGKYKFSRVPIGLFTIEVEHEDYWKKSEPFTMNKDNLAMSLDFILALKRGDIAGVISDKDTEDGIPGVTVELMGTDWAVLTDSSGAYMFTDIPEGTYNLIAYSITYETGTSSGVNVVAPKTTTDNSTMFSLTRKTGSIAGQVVDSESQVGVASASIVVVGTALTTLSSTDGLFTFSKVPIGTLYTLKAAKVGYGVNQVVGLEVKASRTTSQDIELTAGTGSVVGVAKDDDTSQGLAGVSIEVVGTDYRTITVANGSYTMADLPIGNYQVIAYSISYELASVTGVEVKAGEITSVKDFDLTAKVGTIAGQVTDAETGAGLSGVLIRISDSTKSTTTGADGSFNITGVRVGSGYLATFTKSGYQKAEATDITVLPGKTADASQVMTIGTGIIAGTITDKSTNLGIEGATVEVVGTTFKVTTSPSGAYRIEDLPEGIYTIIAYHNDYDTGRLSSLQVAAGVIKSTGTSMQLTKKKGMIAGEITDESTGMGIVNATIRVSGTTMEASSNEFGNYSLNRVPQGTGYTVEVFASGYERASQGGVSVLANQTSIADLALTSKSGSVAGQVYDKSTGKVVPDAIVRVYRTSLQERTGGDGSYVISDIPTSVSGTTVEAAAADYTTEQVGGVPVTAGMTTTVDIGLSPTTGAVSGLVYNQTTGDGIAGATVRLKGTSLTTTTDFAGTYTMIQVPLFPDGTTIEAVAVQFQRGETSGVVTRAGETVTADVMLQPTAGSVAGQVVEKGTGIPIKDALVRLSGAPSAQSKTAEDGTFKLEGIPIAASGSTLEVTAVGYQRVTNSGTTVLPGQTTSVNFEMEQGTGSLSGTITDERTGAGIGAAEVRLLGTSFNQITASDGIYKMEGVPVMYGTTVEVLATGYTTVKVGSVDIEPGKRTHIDIILSPTSGTIVGQVRNAYTSMEIESAQVRIMGSRLTTATDKSGYYTFDSVSTSLDGNTVEVSAVGFDTFRQADVSVNSGEITTVNIDLIPSTGSLAGRIIDEVSSDVIKGATVRLMGTSYTTMTNDSGEYSITNIPTIHSGKTLEVSATGYALKRVEDIDIVPGTIASNDVELSSRVGMVAGDITEALSGQPIESAIVRIMDTFFSTQTDKTGHYEITDVPAAAGYTVEVVVTGYGYQQEGAVTIPAGGVATVNVALTANVGTLAGQVRDSLTVLGLKGAKIRLLGSRFSTTTDDSGYYEFENLPDSLSGNTLEVSKSDYETATAGNVQIIAGGISTQDVSLDPSTGSLAGRVADEVSGDEVKDATIRLIGTSYTTSTDAQGEFTITGIPALHSGKTVEVTASGYAVKLVENIEIVPGTISSYTVELSSQVGVVAGDITDSVSGQPITGATVRIVDTYFSAQTNNVGRYEIKDLPATDGYTIEVVATGYGYAQEGSVTIPSGGVATVNVSLVANVGTLTGQIRDALTGMGLPKASLRLLGSRFSTLSDTSGYYLFEDLPDSLSGNTLEVSMAEYETAYAADVDITPGGVTTQDVSLQPSFASLSGTVTDRVSGDPIEKASIRIVATSYTATTASNGTFLISDIPILHSGKTVEVDAQGFALQLVEDLQLVAGTITSLKVELSSQVGIVTGDVTESLSGQPIDGAIVRIVDTYFSTETDKNGRYEITDVPATSGYTLEVVVTGYAYQEEGGVDVPSGGVATVNLALSANVGTLTGQVRDALTAVGLQSARIRLIGSRFTTSTDSTGYYLFEDLPDSLSGNTLEVSKANYDTATSDNVEIVAGGITTRDINMEPSIGSLAGRVTDEVSDSTVDGATVRLMGTSYTTTTDGKGEFLISGIPSLHSGKTVEVSVQGYATKLVEDIEIIPGTVSRIEVQLSSMVGTVAGEVTETVSAQPVKDAIVRLVGTMFSTKTDSMGRYEITDIPAEDGFTIEVVATGYATGQQGGVNIPAGGVVSTNVSLTPSVGTLVGTVKDSITLEGLKSAKITLLGSRFSTVTNDQGQFEFEDLPVTLNGNTLEVSLSSYSTYQETNVRIAAGEITSLDITLDPTTGALVGRILDESTKKGVGDALVRILGTSYSGTSNSSGSVGSYSLTAIPIIHSGKTVEISLLGYATKQEGGMALVAGTTTTMDVELIRTMGTITGQIKNAVSGDAVADVTVRITGTGFSDATDANGVYELTDIPAATGYTVEAMSLGYSSSDQGGVEVVASGVVIVNLTITADVGAVAGQIMDAGPNTPIDDVIVKIGGTSLAKFETTTDAEGFYAINEIPLNMDGLTIELFHPDYQPKSEINVAVVAGQVTKVDSSLTSNTGTIAGYIIDATTENGIQGATVKLKGTEYEELTTFDGSFTITDVPLPYAGRTIEVRMEGYFMQSQSNVALTAGETTFVNLELKKRVGSVTGTVYSTVEGIGLNNAIVRVVGTDLEDITTADGRYTITNIPVQVDGETTEAMSALLSGYGEQEKTVIIYAGSTSVLDFELTEQTGGIAGVVSDEGTAEGVSGATVRIIGTSVTTKTDGDGFYTITDLHVTTGATVEARASGYQSVTQGNVEIPAGSVTTVDIRLQKSTGNLGGQITDSSTGNGIGGATVRIVGTSKSAVTDAVGVYRIDGVPVISGTTIEVTAANYQRGSVGGITINAGEIISQDITLDPTSGSITGIVTDSKSTNGISGATVRIIGSALAEVTAGDGTYTITGVPVYLDGTTVEVTTSGYRQSRQSDVEVGPGAVTTVNLEMIRSIGSIAGVVTDKSSGSGLSGAVVRIKGTSLSIVTGPDGSYLITDVPTVTDTTVEAFATGYLSSSVASVDILPAETSTVDFSLSPTKGSLVGQITDSTTKSGISGAVVRVTGTSLVTTTASDGTYDIPEVPITSGTTIEAFKIHYDLGYRSNVVIESGTTTTADLELTPSVGVIVGQVIDQSTKQGISGATARVYGTMLYEITAEDGSYTITEVPVSTSGLTVEATARGFERGYTSGIVVDPGATTTSVDIIISPTAGAIAGQIIDQSTGDGLGGATVRVAGTFLSATTATDGSYVITNVAITSGTTIEAVAVGYETKAEMNVEVKAGATTTVDMSLVPKRGDIAGIVTDKSTAQGISSAVVRVGGTSLVAITTTDGTYSITGIPVMTATTVEAIASGYSPSEILSITINPGESTTVNISLELTTGSVAGVVRDRKTAKGISSAIVRVLGTALSTTTNESGTYLIENVPVITGTTVEAVAGGYTLNSASDITVVSGTTSTADINLDPNVGIVTGQITDAGTSAGIEGATVRVAGTALSITTSENGSYTIEEVPVLTGTTVEVFASNYQKGEQPDVDIIAGEAVLVNIQLEPTTASLSGVVVDTKTGSGLSGATVRVAGTALSANTESDGSYTITAVPIGISGTTVEAFRTGYDKDTALNVQFLPGETTTVDLSLLPSTANISGVITNRATGQAISASTVRVSGTSLFAVTGDDGAYTITAVPVGVSGTTVEASATGYTANQELNVELVAGETTSVDIELLPRVGNLTGQIIDSTTQGGVSGAIVRVVGTLLSEETDEDGVFTIIDVPIMTDGTVEAFIVGYTKGVQGGVDVLPGEAATVDIEISPNIGTLVGQVTNASTFVAISGASVRIAGTALSTTTDADGIFLIESVPIGTGKTVEAYAAGFVTDREGGVSVSQGAVTTVDLSLYPSMGVMAGQITDSSTGNGISAAIVRVSGTSLAANTGDDGTYTITSVPARTGITVEVSAVGYQRNSSGGLEVKYGETTIVDLSLTPNYGSIVGIVTDGSTGAGLSTATIRISGTSLSTTTNNSGEYEFESVPIGASGATVEAYATGYTSANEGSVSVVAGEVTMVNLSLLPNTGSISGIVSNQATGSGVSAATVRILGTSISKTTGADGSFTIEDIPITTGTTIEAYLTGFDSTTQGGVAVNAGETTNVDLELVPKTGTLVGLVLDQTTAEGISGAAVRVMGTSLSAVAAADGSYSITDVPVMTGGTVEAFSSGYRSASEGSVDVGPGQTTSVDLELIPTTGIVAGQILNQATGTGLSGATVKVAGTALQTNAASDGSFTITGVPTTSGTTVEAFASGFVAGETGGVEVNPGEASTVTVYLTPNTGVIAGMVTNSKTYLGISGATVRVGGTQRQATTDGNGMYNITDVPVTTNATTVEVFYSGYTSVKEGDVQVKAGETITVDLALTPNVGSIAGVIRKSGTSTPISGAMVRVMGTALFSTTSGEGDYNITDVPVMDTTLEVSAQGYQIKDDVTVTVNSGEVATVNVDLAPGTGSIAGVVSDGTTAQGLSGATVRVSGTDLSITTAADGTYTIPDVPLMTGVTVEAFATGYQDEGSGNLVIAVESGSTTTADLELNPLTGGIVGVVTDASTGDAISGASVRVMGTSLSTTTEGNGAYTQAAVPTKVSGTTVEFFAPGYQSGTVLSVTITAGEFTTVNKALDPTTGDITGRITDSKTSAGVSGATVRIAQTALSDGTDADGIYTITGITVKTGGATVEAFMTGYTSNNVNVTVLAGSVTTVDLSITPNVGSIAGQVIDATTAAPIEGAKVRVAGTQIERTSDEDGLYLITNVAAGTGITLEATAANYTSEEVGGVTVSAGSTTSQTIGLRPITGSLVGQITDVSTGSGITNATVRVVGTEKTGDTQDETGQYTITGIPVDSAAEIQVITIGYSTETNVVAIVGGQASVLDFEMSPKTGTITGFVKDSVTNQGVSEVLVSILGTALSEETDEDGVFTITAVKVKGGSGYTLEARHSNYTVGSTTGITVEPGETTSVSLTFDPNTGNLVGQVVDSGTGESISTATVRIAGTSLSATSDVAGAYEITDIPLDGQTEEVTVTFTAPNYTSITGATIEIVYGQTTLLDQQLTPNYGAVAGTVMDSGSGAALTTATVRLLGTLRSANVDGSGNFEITNVPVKTGIVAEATASGFGTATVEVTMTAGSTTTVVLQLTSATGTIAGLVTDELDGHGISGATVRVVGTSLQETTNEDGFYEITDVLADSAGGASVEVTATNYAMGKSRETITAGSTAIIDVTLEPNVGHLSGLVIDADTGQAISGANVSVVGTQHEVAADGSGVWEITDIYVDLDSGTSIGVTLEVSVPEYETLEQNVTVTRGVKVYSQLELQGVTGTITGQVTDSSTGAVVTGARVQVQGTALYETTGSDGAFEIEDVPVAEGGETMTVDVTASGYLSRSGDGSLERGGTVSIDLELTPNTGTIAGIVTDYYSGEALEAATVRVQGTAIDADTASNGSYSVADILVDSTGTREVTIEVVLANYQTTTEVVEIAGGSTVSSDIKLKPLTGVVAGFVTDSTTGEALSGATVQLLQGSVDPEDTDGDGAFSIAGLSTSLFAGTSVEATMNGYFSKDVAIPATFGGSQLTVSLNIPMTPNTAKIEGTVTDKTSGQPIEGALVLVVGTGKSVDTDENGAYEIADISISSEDGEDKDLQVSKVGYKTYTTSVAITLNPGETVAKDVELDPSTGSVAGTITNSVQGTAISGITVVVKGTTYSDDTGEDGTYSITGISVEVGTTRDIEIMASGSGYVAGESDTVTLSPGEREVVDLALTPNVGSIAGQVVDSSTGYGMTAATIRILGTGFEQTTEADGTFLIQDVPPQQGATIEAAAPGYASVALGVTIEAGKTSQVNFTSDDALDPLWANVVGIVYDSGASGTVDLGDGNVVRGLPVPGAIVSFDNDINSYTVATGTDGTFSIGNIQGDTENGYEFSAVKQVFAIGSLADPVIIMPGATVEVNIPIQLGAEELGLEIIGLVWDSDDTGGDIDVGDAAEADAIISAGTGLSTTSIAYTVPASGTNPMTNGEYINFILYVPVPEGATSVWYLMEAQDAAGAKFASQIVYFLFDETDSAWVQTIPAGTPAGTRRVNMPLE